MERTEPLPAVDGPRRRRSRRAVPLLDDPERAEREIEGRTGRSTVAGIVGTFHCVDLVVHGWDLAQAAGLDATVPSDQLTRVREKVEQLSDIARAPEVFGPQVQVPEGADETTRTMAFLGRLPVGAP